MKTQLKKKKIDSPSQQWNELAMSLLDISSESALHQNDFIEYLSEHLYIQLHIAGHCDQSANQDPAQQRFIKACKKLYYAEDEQSRRDAINEARLHLAA